MQAAQLQKSGAKLENQAREAIGAGREDLARQALTRRAAVRTELEQLEEQHEQLKTQEANLIEGSKKVEARIQQFRTKKETMKAQYSAAEAQVRINEAATGIGREMDNTGLAIQRAKDRTEEMQARASALDELVSSGDLQELGSDQTQLDRELQQLASQQQVDRELEQLKAEVGSGAPQKELEGTQQEQSPGA